MEVSVLSGGTKHTLETVRVLHETVLALRTALEGSRKELSELRSKFRERDNASSVREMEETEERPEEEKADSGAESEDIDDIELVFTTGETDPASIQEDMVPIRDRPGMHTVLVETDISKCGVIDENEAVLSSRRNTLPDPLPYRPIIHREIIAAARAARGSPRKARGRQETGAQTDITAVPALWKSETYLAHKISCNLTTLPSKFTLPVPRSSHLPLSDKSREARRVLLSDINFTSMVPELSRSADHLHQDEVEPQHPSCCWDTKVPVGHGSRSSWGSRHQTSVTSILPEESLRRNSCRVPCCRHSWSSCHPFHHPDEPFTSPSLTSRRIRRPVHHRCCPGQSLPDLRPEGDSGESTDSLIDEAEEFLRRSIDNILLSKTCKKAERRHSESDSPGFEPAKSSQPFLPKSARDLKPEYLVKVITADGRIVMGRVRYSGHVVGKPEPHVGIELRTNSGGCDGTFLGHRYFDCKPDHAIFVPFKKVVLAWST